MHFRKRAFSALPLIVLLASGCNLNGSGSGTSSEAVHGGYQVAKYDCSWAATPAPDLATVDTGGTPYGDYSAEMLALEASGEFIAPRSLYDRVHAELTGLQQRFPLYAGIVDKPCLDSYYGTIYLTVSQQVSDEIDAGVYHDWDAMNANLHASYWKSSYFGSSLMYGVSFGTGGLDTSPHYNFNNLIQAYKALRGVEAVTTDHARPSYGTACLAIRDTYHYFIFDKASGDCPSGCIRDDYYGFEVDDGGNIRYLGHGWTDSTSNVPEWLLDLQDCIAFLPHGYKLPTN